MDKIEAVINWLDLKDEFLDIRAEFDKRIEQFSLLGNRLDDIQEQFRVGFADLHERLTNLENTVADIVTDRMVIGGY